MVVIVEQISQHVIPVAFGWCLVEVGCPADVDLGGALANPCRLVGKNELYTGLSMLRNLISDEVVRLIA